MACCCTTRMVNFSSSFGLFQRCILSVLVFSKIFTQFLTKHVGALPSVMFVLSDSVLRGYSGAASKSRRFFSWQCVHFCYNLFCSSRIAERLQAGQCDQLSAAPLRVSYSHDMSTFDIYFLKCNPIFPLSEKITRCVPKSANQRKVQDT